MKITQKKIASILSIVFGLLSLLSFWNSYNWNILGWGSQLFLFPFLALISFMAKLSPNKPKKWIYIQFALLLLHTTIYIMVWYLQNPYRPNLLLLLVPVLCSTAVLIWSKISRLGNDADQQKLLLQKKGIYFTLLIAMLLYTSMGIFVQLKLVLPGIIFETIGLIGYFYLLIKYSD